MMTRLGASRMSSVLGLNARPHIAKVLPDRSSPYLATTLSTRTIFCSSLTSSTALSIFEGMPISAEVMASAFTSLGKHEPP